MTPRIVVAAAAARPRAGTAAVGRVASDDSRKSVTKIYQPLVLASCLRTTNCNRCSVSERLTLRARKAVSKPLLFFGPVELHQIKAEAASQVTMETSD